jgi:hypothetical protein
MLVELKPLLHVLTYSHKQHPVTDVSGECSCGIIYVIPLDQDVKAHVGVSGMFYSQTLGQQMKPILAEARCSDLTISTLVLTPKSAHLYLSFCAHSLPG